MRGYCMYMNTETLTGYIARPVTMSVTDHATKLVTATRTFPAGTEVYAHLTRDGLLSIRVPGTLYTQRVQVGVVEPA